MNISNPRIRLKDLTIEKYLDVVPGHVAFNDGINVLVGRNAAGKCTLLELVLKIISGRIHEEYSQDLIVSYTLLLGDIAELRMRLEMTKKRGDAISANIDERLSGAKNTAFDHKGIGRIVSAENAERAINFRIDNYRVLFTDEQGKEVEAPPRTKGGELFQFFTIIYLANELKIPKSRVEDLFSPILDACFLKIFDEGLVYFNDMMLGVDFSFEIKPNTAPQTTYVSLIRGAVSPLIMDIDLNDSNVSPPTAIAISDEKFDFIRDAKAVLKANKVEVRYSLIDSTVDQKGVRKIKYGDPSIFIYFGDRRVVGHKNLSYGQKRMLSFALLCAQSNSFLISDELVNGLHHEMIMDCLGKLGDRQVFLTSQNPLLFDCLSFDGPGDVERRFIQCSAHDDLFAWKNVDPDTAAEIYQSIQVGIRHVSEILIEKGLW